jgi:hypothetical protein
MNESQPSSDRDRDAAGAEKYRQRRAKELLQFIEADHEQVLAETAAEPSADGDPDDAPSDDLSDGRDAADPADQLAWLLAAGTDEAFTGRVFQDFEERLAELAYRVMDVLEHGRVDAGRRQALLERIADSGRFLVELADAVETKLGGSEH